MQVVAGRWRGSVPGPGPRRSGREVAWCRVLVPAEQSPVSSRAEKMSAQDTQHDPVMEDCSDTDEEFYPYHNNNNNNNNNNVNNNNTEFEDKNNNSSSSSSSRDARARAVPSFHKLQDRPLNITVTAKVLFGSVSAISALNAERKKKPS